MDILKDTCSFALSGARVKCEFEADDDIRPVSIDPSQISQVINNLVINANQAMPYGGIIKVRAVNYHYRSRGHYLPLPNGHYILISVEDEGTGIEEDIQSKIFDPYFTTKESGNGLGLSTSYSIIKNHGGHIEFTSRPGRGTIFDIYLPVAEREPEKELQSDNGIVSGRGRVLIMDDEQTILDITSEALTYMGYKVDVARDGREAVEKYIKSFEDQSPFDAVIMDLTIPGGIGGKEAIAHIRRINPAVRAVVSSGYSQDPVMADYRTYGFMGVLPKPFQNRRTQPRDGTGAGGVTLWFWV